MPIFSIMFATFAALWYLDTVIAAIEGQVEPWWWTLGCRVYSGWHSKRLVGKSYEERIRKLEEETHKALSEVDDYLATELAPDWLAKREIKRLEQVKKAEERKKKIGGRGVCAICGKSTNSVVCIACYKSLAGNNTNTPTDTIRTSTIQKRISSGRYIKKGKVINNEPVTWIEDTKTGKRVTGTYRKCYPNYT